MVKKVVIIAVCVISVAIIVAWVTLASVGYIGYNAIAETVKAPQISADGSFVIMSANIRRKEKWYSTSKMDTGSHRWYNRARYYLKNIEQVQPDILGAQEVVSAQYKFLTEHLEGYGSVVTYRDDRGSRSESCPIFYNEARFELLGSGTYWLSKTPEKMSKDWGAKEYRITTYARLKDKTTNLEIVVFNAHPEWKIDEGRNEELIVLAQKTEEAMATADKVILLGDLNTDKQEPDNAGINALAPIDALLADSKDLAGVYYGYTFQNYGVYNEEDPAAGLDYIYLPKTAVVSAVGKVTAVYDGVYPSDHFPIWARVKSL